MTARTAMTTTLALWLLFLPAVHIIAEGATHADIVRDRFQQLLDQWGYDEWWSMWEHGTSRSRSAISRELFAQKMGSSP